jgi:hypothetical protein
VERLRRIIKDEFQLTFDIDVRHLVIVLTGSCVLGIVYVNVQQHSLTVSVVDWACVWGREGIRKCVCVCLISFF